MSRAPLDELTADVGAAVVRAGFSIRDINAPEGTEAYLVGGVVVLQSDLALGGRPAGVLVHWELHDDLGGSIAETEDAEDERNPDLVLYRRVRRVMHDALVAVLQGSGFTVVRDPHPFLGQRAQLVVTGRRAGSGSAS